MPESAVGWLMFAFFAGGATGGWVLLILFAVDQFRAWRKV